MKYTAIATLLLAAMAGAQSKTVVSAAPTKTTDYATKKALAMESDGMYACPDGFSMFVRRVKPDKQDKNTPPTDYESYFHIPDGNIVRETPDNKLVFACFEEK